MIDMTKEQFLKRQSEAWDKFGHFFIMAVRARVELMEMITKGGKK